MTQASGGTANTLRQHGAMEHSNPPCDLDEMRRYRLGRVREALAARDLAGIILYDPLNIRYATDASNHAGVVRHNEARYLYVPAEGPVRLFEFGGGSDLLTAGSPPSTRSAARPMCSISSRRTTGGTTRGPGRLSWTR